MLSPDYILRLSEGAEEIASDLHSEIINQIVRRIVLRLQRGDGYLLTARDKWQLEVLQDAGYLLEDIQAEIAKKTRLQRKELKAAFEDAGVQTLRYDNAVYKAAGISETALTQSPYLLRVLQRSYEATLQEWANYTRTTALAAQQLFIRQCDRAYNQVVSGAVSYTEAVKEAVTAISRDGVYVDYPSGWRDTIETATLRAVRTGVAQTCGQVTMTQAVRNGITLALTSAHMGARPTHEVWQGRVFWIDWNRLSTVWPVDTMGHAEATAEEKAKYRELVAATELGEITGLMGVNCRHSVSPYIEGVSHNPFEKIDTEENRKAYELSQRQRELERRIRKTKREVMGLKTGVDNADKATRPGLELEYQKKSALLKKQNGEYNRFCEENGLKRLDERLSIAQWDRKQATAAARAAQAVKTQSTILANSPLYTGIIPKGVELSSIRFIAGYGSKTEFRDVSYYVQDSGGDPLQWQKKGGIIQTENFKYDVHWVERNGKHYSEKCVRVIKP